jgi:hypothetical protein
MTNEPDPAEDAREPVDRDKTRRAVAKLMKGSTLPIREQAHEITISNPVLPERGEIIIEHDGAHVTLARLTYEYWGQLDGFDDGENDEITRKRISDALGEETP